jgi:hypothetical protein
MNTASELGPHTQTDRGTCRGQACGGMHGAMARIAKARPATQRSTTTYLLDRFHRC